MRHTGKCHLSLNEYLLRVNTTRGPLIGGKVWYNMDKAKIANNFFSIYRLVFEISVIKVIKFFKIENLIVIILETKRDIEHISYTLMSFLFVLNFSKFDNLIVIILNTKRDRNRIQVCLSSFLF